MGSLVHSSFQSSLSSTNSWSTVLFNGLSRLLASHFYPLPFIHLSFLILLSFLRLVLFLSFRSFTISSLVFRFRSLRFQHCMVLSDKTAFFLGFKTLSLLSLGIKGKKLF